MKTFQQPAAQANLLACVFSFKGADNADKHTLAKPAAG
jgi:hypothetical protein